MASKTYMYMSHKGHSMSCTQHTHSSIYSIFLSHERKPRCLGLWVMKFCHGSGFFENMLGYMLVDMVGRYGMIW